MVVRAVRLTRTASSTVMIVLVTSTADTTARGAWVWDVIHSGTTSISTTL